MAEYASLSTRMLYRRVLRAVQSYPSVKRGQIFEEVREEFRKNMGERDAGRVEQQRRAAIESLRQLEQYRGKRFILELLMACCACSLMQRPLRAAMDDSKSTWELQLTGGTEPRHGDQ